MRKAKPFVLLIPSQCMEVLEHYLINNKVPFRYKRENFYYLINYIATKQINNKNYEYVSINKRELKALTKSNIDKYLTLLVGIGLVKEDAYQVGVKSKWYKLNELYSNGLQSIEIKTNTKLFNNINKRIRNNNSHVCRLPQHLQLMRKEFFKLDFDYELANDWILNNANGGKLYKYTLSLNALKDGRTRYFNRNKTNNRLDTNLTTLKSDLRQFIKGDYVSIDLVNSQPFLLGMLLDSIINNKDTLCLLLSNIEVTKAFSHSTIKKILITRQNKEIQELATFNNYLTSTKEGLLYDNFISVFDNELSRKEVKQMFFKVLFSAVDSYKKEKAKFKSVYPIISSLVELLKEKKYKTLPIYLQKLESYLFIDCISKNLVEFGIIPLTIHDSVIVKKEQLQQTILIMEKVFNKELGVIPTFKIESIAN
jgi:hypothetical protein